MKSDRFLLGAAALAAAGLLAFGCGGDGDGAVPSSGGTGAQGGAGGAAGQGGTSGTAGTGGGTGGTGATGGTAGTGGTGGTAGSSGSGGVGGAAGAAGAAGQGGAAGCVRVPGPDDFPRKIVVSHPRDATGAPANAYEVLDLSVDGEITRPGTTFEMGPGEGEIVFTPDGKVGIVAQDQGQERSLGVFRFDDNGDPQVVHAAFKGGFYAGPIVMDPGGQFAYVLDSEWANIGGGIYKVAIGCDGTLLDMGRLVEAKLPYGLTLLPGPPGRALLASSDVLGSPAGTEAHLIDLSGAPARIASVDAFGDDDSIVASTAVTADGVHGLLGDDSMFGGERVAVVRIDGDALSAVQVLANLPAPVAIVPSPNNDVVLVVSEFPDDLWVLDYDPGQPAQPFSIRGKLPYVGNGPALPSTSVMIERGSLKGHVFVSDLYGVRHVAFNTGPQGVEDRGLFETGQDFVNNVEALGVQK